jgi:cytochrome oxidase assembly protein ShyY1
VVQRGAKVEDDGNEHKRDEDFLPGHGGCFLMTDQSQSSATFVKSRTFWFGTVLAAIAVAGFVSLGFWQWDRAVWKTRYLDGHAKAVAAEPQPLDEALARAIRESRSDLPLPVRAYGTGRFVPERSVFLDNQRRGPDVGALVFTLFLPDNGLPPLLVNRGWIALDALRQPTGRVEPPDGTVAVSGLLRRPPSQGLRLGQQPPLNAAGGPPLLPWLDLDELGAAWGLSLPSVVLELGPESLGGFRRDTDPLPNTLTPEKHRGYAVQWWGLAMAVAAIWLVLVWRAWSRRPVHNPPVQ